MEKEQTVEQLKSQLAKITAEKDALKEDSITRKKNKWRRNKL